MLTLGCDPDLHDLAVASWDDLGPVAAHVVSIPRKLTGGEAVLAMMHELSKPWPEFARPAAAGPIDQELPDWCAVEAQESRPVRGRKHARPQDLVHLGNVAGLAMMRVARGYLHGCGLYFPAPSEWKGSVPKQAMQARLYEELGWGYEVHGGKGAGRYCTPKTGGLPLTGASHARIEPWKHVGDALLLARWCWEQAQGCKWVRA